jgi:hypothetical protein
MVDHLWQKINVQWHSCHSWHDLDGGMITAMTFLIIVLAVAAVLATQAVTMLLHDGRGPAAPPRSHVQDPQFSAPAASR